MSAWVRFARAGELPVSRPRGHRWKRVPGRSVGSFLARGKTPAIGFVLRGAGPGRGAGKDEPGWRWVRFAVRAGQGMGRCRESHGVGFGSVRAEDSSPGGFVSSGAGSRESREAVSAGHFEREPTRAAVSWRNPPRSSSRARGGGVPRIASGRWISRSGGHSGRASPAVGCCWVRQWSVPRPRTRSTAWMPTTSRSGKTEARAFSAWRSLGSLKVGTRTRPLAT